MKTRVSLAVGLSSAGVRESLQSVLAPDNVGIPRGTRLASKAEGTALIFDVRSESASTALSTALALLRDISLFQEVWLLSHGRGAKVRRAGRN